MPVNRARSSANPPAPLPSIANPADPTTIADLRLKVIEILQALRSQGIIAPAGAGTRDRTKLDSLTYTAVNNSSYTYYYWEYNMTSLYDGSYSQGMMANESKVFVQVQLSKASHLNRITLYAGQFNGAYNIPRSMKVYAGLVTSDTAAPLYQATIAVSMSQQSFDLSNVAGFDTPSDTYTFVLDNSINTAISINEMQLFGQAL